MYLHNSLSCTVVRKTLKLFIEQAFDDREHLSKFEHVLQKLSRIPIRIPLQSSINRIFEAFLKKEYDIAGSVGNHKVTSDLFHYIPPTAKRGDIVTRY